jgi:hypothetical protein
MSYIGSTPTTQSFIAGTDSFNGTGSATNFTLSRLVNSTNDIQVVVNNVVQYPPNYSVSGNTLTISPAPSAGTNNVYVRYLSTTLQSIAPSQGIGIQFGIGSLALPSISFIGDTNTGIYSPAADTIAFVEGGTEAMRIDSSANVGIGTSSPTVYGSYRTLEVRGTGGGLVQFGTGATTAAYLFQDGTNSGFNNIANGVMTFGTNNTERMRINSSGNFGVGTTTPGTSYSELVNFTATATNQPSLTLLNTNASFANDVFQVRAANSSANGNSWNMITGWSSTTTLNFLVRGNGNVLNSNSSYGSLSDQRIKENIVDATPKLESLKQVRIVNFNLIGDNQKQIGVVAQELEQIFPGMVEEDSEGMKAVKYSVFVPMLVKAIQEQQAMIDTMKQEIAELKAKVGE